MIFLDEITHTYTVEGLKYPSVTQILQDCGVSITQYFDEQSRIRGSYVHQACEYYDQSDLNLDDIDVELMGYIQAYITFRLESKFDPLLNEFKVFNRFYNYCGTLDRLGTLNKKTVLIDIKSGSVPEWTGLQTAAYVAALKAMPSADIPIEIPNDIKRFALNLTAEGKYKLIEYKNIDDVLDFYAAARIYQWKRQVNKK